MMRRDDVMAIVRETGHSRFPYSPTGEIDDVVGVILVKELLDWLLLHDNDDVDWNFLRRDALVIPESLALARLLRTFQESQRHLAIVVDEYGSIQGIATMEDVLEEIVGEIYDESDRPSNDIVKLKGGGFQVAASVDLRKLSATLGITWEPEWDISTVGGLVSETLEQIPSVGDSINWQGYRITVLQADRQRAKLLSVRKT
jgi:CBS domain containing-hemolysin-like protein